MKILDKIDSFINGLEEKKKKSKKLPFLYTTEDLDGLKLDDEVKERLVEAKKRKVGGPDYDKFFTKMLKKWKIKSYKDLPKNKQKEFFDDVDAKWNSKKEKGKNGKN